MLAVQHELDAHLVVVQLHGFGQKRAAEWIVRSPMHDRHEDEAKVVLVIRVREPFFGSPALAVVIGNFPGLDFGVGCVLVFQAGFLQQGLQVDMRLLGRNRRCRESEDKKCEGEGEYRGFHSFLHRDRRVPLPKHRPDSRKNLRSRAHLEKETGGQVELARLFRALLGAADRLQFRAAIRRVGRRTRGRSGTNPCCEAGLGRSLTIM